MIPTSVRDVPHTFATVCSPSVVSSRTIDGFPESDNFVTFSCLRAL